MKSGRDDGEPFEVEQTEFEDWKNAAEKLGVEGETKN